MTINPTSIDAMLSERYKPDEPGAAVIVCQEGAIVFRKGYGLANLELNVPIEPHMVFRIGSVTKQFTAVAILLLYEEGKLDLQEPLERFLPDYPTRGKTITVEHLLTHSSGIRSYTDMPEWMPLMRKDLKVEELIALFKDQPMDFEPGERWQYNNSGYILLGAILEKVSGITVQRRFSPVEVDVKTDKPLPAERQAIELEASALERYAGKYELAPGVVFTILFREGKGFAQMTGQPEIEIFAEKPGWFFAKVVDAQIEIKEDDLGAVSGLVIHQGGNDLPAKKVG